MYRSFYLHYRKIPNICTIKKTCKDGTAKHSEIRMLAQGIKVLPEKMIRELAICRHRTASGSNANEEI